MSEVLLCCRNSFTEQASWHHARSLSCYEDTGLRECHWLNSSTV